MCRKTRTGARVGEWFIADYGQARQPLNGGTLERAQAIAAHESPRTTKLYDRTADEVDHRGGGYSLRTR